MAEQLTIDALEHVRNTTNGNSVWKVHFTNGRTHLTKPDGSVGALLGSSWAGKRVDVEFNAGGRIIDLVRI